MVGRESDCAAVVAALERSARVALVGATAVGITTVAAATAADGVWIDLHGVTERWGMLTAVADALDVAADAEGDESVQLGRLASARGALLVFDHGAGCAGPLRELLDDWHAHEPGVRAMVAGQEALGMVGEETIVLVSLQPAEGGELLLRRTQSWSALGEAARRAVVHVVALGARVDRSGVLDLLGGDWEQPIAEAVAAGWLATGPQDALTVTSLDVAFVRTTALFGELGGTAREQVHARLVARHEAAIATGQPGAIDLRPDRRHREAVAAAGGSLGARAALVLATPSSRRAPVPRLLQLLERVIEDVEVEPDLRADALVRRGWLHWESGRRTPARYDFEDAVALAVAPQVRGRAIAGLARVKLHNGSNDDALRDYREATELALQSGDTAGARSIRQHLPLVLVALDRSQAEIDGSVRDSTADLREAGDARTEGALVAGLARVLVAVGRSPEAAVDLDRRAIRCFRRAADARSEAGVQLHLAGLLADAGAAGASAEAAEAARLLWTELGHVGAAVDAAAHAAVCERVCGRPAGVEDLRADAARVADTTVGARVDVAAAELHLLDGKPGPARRLLYAAIGVLEGADSGASLAHASHLLGCVHLLLGAPDEALPRLARARRGWTECGVPARVVRSQCLIAVAEAKAGRARQAAEASMSIRVRAGGPRAARLAVLTEAFLDVRAGGAAAAERWYRRFRAEGGWVEATVVERLLGRLLG
ncbi:MAG: tetratricopeptide (TPR) repeat protein [Myxococcota bacterium]|jgi:tetratricopeptide (TPR) repeat protein